MFENDDVDFYRERLNPDNPHQVWFIDHWEDLKIRREAIKVKGSADVVFEVRTSRHGPILNEVDEKIARGAREPVASWWVVNRMPMNTPQAFYRLSHVRSMEDARQAAAMIDVVGLNVLYGDRDGNIAWWAAGRLIKRPKHVNSKLFLDGASGRDEPLGFYDFSQNPRSENPSSGFVYSANNQPSLSSGNLYPGYYVPEDRARRITEFLNSDTVWSTESMQQMTLDCTSGVFVAVTREVLKALENESVLKMTPAHELAYRILLNWQGDHQITDAAPTIFYTLLAYIMENSMADELGMESFRAIVSSHLIKRTIPDFIKNDPSLWWDDIHTAEIKETRRMIFARSFDQAVRLLISKIGREPADWYWGKVHTLEHPHLLGRQKPLDAVFNVGPFKAMGGNETIANLGFRLNSPGNYPVVFGPAMRIILDFADIENSLSVNPTGQSGYFLSPHYADQSRLFNAGRLRKQMMNREEITKSGQGTLILMPD